MICCIGDLYDGQFNGNSTLGGGSDGVMWERITKATAIMLME